MTPQTFVLRISDTKYSKSIEILSQLSEGSLLFSNPSHASLKVAGFAARGRLWVIFNRTDLRKAVSGAKFDAESDYEVRLAVDPPKSISNDKKLISKTENNSDFFVSFLDVFGTARRHSRLKF